MIPWSNHSTCDQLVSSWFLTSRQLHWVTSRRACDQTLVHVIRPSHLWSNLCTCDQTFAFVIDDFACDQTLVLWITIFALVIKKKFALVIKPLYLWSNSFTCDQTLVFVVELLHLWSNTCICGRTLALVIKHLHMTILRGLRDPPGGHRHNAILWAKDQPWNDP